MKSHFTNPMKKTEKILGFLYLAIHIVLLPWLLPILYEHFHQRLHIALSDPGMNLVYYIISFVFVLVFLFRYLRGGFSDFIDSPLRSLQAIILAYFFNYIATLLLSVLLALIMKETVNPNSQEVIRQTKLDPNAVMVIAVLLAPIVEETLFRGALFGAVREKSRFLAYVASILLFALYHLWQFFLGGFQAQDLLYLLQYLPAGLALCWCYERSGTIWAPILLHAAINFISIKVTLG